MSIQKQLKPGDYGLLDVSGTNPTLKYCLVLLKDATWHLYRSEHDSRVPIDWADRLNVSENQIASGSAERIWKNWEDFDLHISMDIALKQHQLLFGWAPSHKKAQKTLVTLAIWAYRAASATSYLGEIPVFGANGAPVRRSAIAGRHYKVLPMPAELKLLSDGSGIVDNKGRKITGKQGLACYRILVQHCGAELQCTEGTLKQAIEHRASEVTPKVDTVWRFFQFYRPIFVKAGLIEYMK